MRAMSGPHFEEPRLRRGEGRDERDEDREVRDDGEYAMVFKLFRGMIIYHTNH